MNEETAIAVLQTNYKNLTESIVELKCDVKETKKSVDDLTIEFQKFGGLYNQQEKINRRVSSLEKWQNKIIGALILTEVIILPLAIWKIIDSMSK